MEKKSLFSLQSPIQKVTLTSKLKQTREKFLYFSQICHFSFISDQISHFFHK